jgi:hypothetical protein
MDEKTIRYGGAVMGAIVILSMVFAAFTLGFLVARLLHRSRPDQEYGITEDRMDLGEVPDALLTMLANLVARFLAWHACRSWALLHAFKGARAEYRQGLRDAEHLGAVAPVYPVGGNGRAILQEGRRT